MSKRSSPTVKCGFCEKIESPYQMRQSADSKNDDYPLFFCCECCSYMYSCESGCRDMPGQTKKESYDFYLDTLKRCYPNIYKKKYGNNL